MNFLVQKGAFSTLPRFLQVEFLLGLWKTPGHRPAKVASRGVFPQELERSTFWGLGRWRWLMGWCEWRGGGEVKRRIKKPPHQREAQLAKAACFWSYFWYDRYDPWGAKWFPNLSHISIELFIAKARKKTTAGCFVCLLHIFGKLCCISLYLFGNSFLNCRGCIKTLTHRGDSFNPVQP